MDNLFNGDKVLGTTMNLFLNENWSAIYNEMQKPLSVAQSKVDRENIQKIFDNTPYKDMFLE